MSVSKKLNHIELYQQFLHQIKKYKVPDTGTIAK